MSTQRRVVSLGEALTLATGIAFTENFDRVHELVEWMAGEPTWTHQIPRVGREIEAWMKRRWPELAAIDVSTVTPENWRRWLAARVEEMGAEFTLERMPGDDHRQIDPLTEGVEVFGKPPVAVIVVETERD